MVLQIDRLVGEYIIENTVRDKAIDLLYIL